MVTYPSKDDPQVMLSQWIERDREMNRKRFTPEEKA
jgi:hypothetical protein